MEGGRQGGGGGVERLVRSPCWRMTDSFLHQLEGRNVGSDGRGNIPTTVRWERVHARKINNTGSFTPN